MAVGQQKSFHAFRIETVLAKDIDDAAGFDTSPGIDEHKLCATTYRIHVAVVWMCIRATCRTTGHQGNGLGKFHAISRMMIEITIWRSLQIVKHFAELDQTIYRALRKSSALLRRSQLRITLHAAFGYAAPTVHKMNWSGTE